MSIVGMRVKSRAAYTSVALDRDFWVYENWTVRPQKAVIHAGECRHCNHGMGKNGTTNETHGCWHGPYKSMGEAEATARQTGRKVWSCGTCK